MAGRRRKSRRVRITEAEKTGEKRREKWREKAERETNEGSRMAVVIERRSY